MLPAKADSVFSSAVGALADDPMLISAVYSLFPANREFYRNRRELVPRRPDYLAEAAAGQQAQFPWPANREFHCTNRILSGHNKESVRQSTRKVYAFKNESEGLR